MSTEVEKSNAETCENIEPKEKDNDSNDKYDPFDLSKSNIENNDDDKNDPNLDNYKDDSNKDDLEKDDHIEIDPEHEEDSKEDDTKEDDHNEVDLEHDSNKDDPKQDDKKEIDQEHDEHEDDKYIDTDAALNDIIKSYLEESKDIDDSNNLIIDEMKIEIEGDDDDNEEKSQHDDNEINHDNDNQNDEEFMKLFLSRIKLDDNTDEFLFSSGLRYSRLQSNGIHYSKSFSPINCHLCKCSTIKGKTTLQTHIQSEEHQKLLNGPPPNAQEYRKPLIQSYGIKNIVTPIKIYPGENIKRITPEYYDRVLPIKECEFRPRPSKKLIDELKNDPIHEYNQKAPVLGLCYAFKMKINARSVLYYCTLCHSNLYGEPYQHFVGAGHQADYILRHFKELHLKVNSELEKHIKKGATRRRAVRSIFRVLYRKIELVRGLRQISVIDARAFFKSQKTLEKVCRNPLFQYHYDENSIDFDENEIQDLIKKAIKADFIILRDPMTLKNVKKLNDKKIPLQPLITSTPIKAAVGETKNTFTSKMNSTEIETSSAARRRRRRGGRNRGEKDNTTMTKPPPPLLETAHDIPANWDRYRRMLGATLDDLDEKYDRYEANPENHPKYENEWKIFWRRRIKELERDKIDPERYDFKPEWENVWAVLLKQFYDSDVARRKYDIKKSLKLPLTKRSPSPIRRRHILLKSNSRSRSPQRLLSSSHSREYNNTRYRSPSPRTRLRSLSPSARYYQQQRQQQQQQQHYSYTEHHSSYDDYRHEHEKLYNRDEKRRRSRSPISSSSAAARAMERSSSSSSSEQLSVISILRLLTALEDQLGSLGPKAIDFLGKAILFEKENKGNSNQLIKDQELYIFFMTSMEKLRGQIMANIVPSHKIHAVKNVVNDLEVIIQKFDEYKRQNHVIFGNGGNKSLPSIMSPPRAQIAPAANFYRNVGGSGGGGGGNISNDSLMASSNLHGNEYRNRNQRSGEPEPLMSLSKTRHNFESIDYRSEEGRNTLNQFNSGSSNQNRHESQDSSIFGKNKYSSSDSSNQFNKDPRFSMYNRGTERGEIAYNPNMYAGSGIAKSNEKISNSISPSRLASGSGFYQPRTSGGGGGGAASAAAAGGAHSGFGTMQKGNNSIYYLLPSSSSSTSYNNPFRAEAAAKAANNSRSGENSDYVYSSYTGFTNRSNY